MNTPFRKNLVWSALFHVGGLGLIALWMGFAVDHHPPPDAVQWFDVAAIQSIGQPEPLPAEPTPAAPSDPTPEPAPPEPEPPSPPTPAPPAIEPEPPPSPSDPDPVAPPQPPPKPSPKPKEPVQTPPPSKTEKSDPTPKPKPKIAVSNRKVVRAVKTSSPKASAPHAASSSKSDAGSFDASAFAKRLLSKMPNSGGLVSAREGAGTGTSAHGQVSDFGWYFNHIFQEMYGTWRPPFGASEGLQTGVLLRIEKNGVISKVSLASSSGNPLMDESALAAAHRVKKLKPLPQGLGETYAEITVTFKIQKP